MLDETADDEFYNENIVKYYNEKIAAALEKSGYTVVLSDEEIPDADEQLIVAPNMKFNFGKSSFTISYTLYDFNVYKYDKPKKAKLGGYKAKSGIGDDVERFQWCIDHLVQFIEKNVHVERNE